MKKLLFLFSHNPTKDQLEDAKKSLGVSEIIYLTEEVKSKWSNIPNEFNGIEKVFQDYIKENCNEGDYILIEGHFGIVFKMVTWALQNKYIPIYSQTNRVYKEETGIDGVVKNIHYFKHIMYKLYE